MIHDIDHPIEPDESADHAECDDDVTPPAPRLLPLPIPAADFPEIDDRLPEDGSPPDPTPDLPSDQAVAVVAASTQRREQSPRQVSIFDVPPSTRQIMLPWCIWLLGSWAVALWLESPAAAIRWMLFSSLFGIMLAWPTFRLSQDGRSKSRRGYLPSGSRADALELREVRPPRRQLLTPGVMIRDWFSLNLVFQAVIWPLRITAGWEWEQAIWIDIAFASWSLLVGGLAAWGCRYRTNAGRATAALIIMLVMLGEPVLLAAMAWFNELTGATLPDWSMRLSPIETLFTLTAAAGLFEPGPWRFNLIAVAAAAVLAWAFALVAWRSHSLKQAASSRV